MLSNRIKTFSYSGLAGAILAAIPIYVQAAAPADEASVSQLRQELAQQSKRLAAQERALKEQEKQLLVYKHMLEKTMQEQQRRMDEMQAQQSSGTKAHPKATAQVEAKPTAPPPPKAPPQPARTAQAAPEVVGKAPEPRKESQPPPVAPITDELSLLTPRGKFVVEPSMQYTFSSAISVDLVGFTIIPAINIGLINIASVDHSTLVTSVAARYGITNRLEVEAVLPYVSRRDTSITRPVGTSSVTESSFNASGNGIGDVKFAARYQLNSGAGDTPYYIGSLAFKTHTGKDPYEVEYDTFYNLQKTLPTGSGFYSLQPGLTIIYPSDPAVFFGGVSYAWNIKRDINRTIGGSVPTFIETVDPGDSLTLNFGMGVSMNERASFSMGYQHSIIGKDKLSSSTVSITPDPRAKTYQLGSLLLGYSYSGKNSLNLLLGIGVTKDAPDTQLTLRVPFSF